MDLRIFTEPQQGASYDSLLAVALHAEALGFSAFFRSDHYLVMGGGSGLPGPTDAWVTLAGLARDTTSIRLGTLMSAATFRLPGPLAIAVAQVDAMSGGRVELGIGSGWYEEEHVAHGIPFPSLGERFDRFEEQVEIIDGLWRTPVGATYSFSGRHYSLVDSPALPKPVQSPRPPLLIGGHGVRRTPLLAARYADEYNSPFPDSVSRFASDIARVRSACESVGRDPSSLVMSAALVVCVGSSVSEVSRRAAAIGREPAELRSHGLAGTVDEVVEVASAYRDAGAQRIYCQVLDLTDLDHVSLLASEVVPQLT
jgi:F420-dependent oxidoreductase-like protein